MSQTLSAPTAVRPRPARELMRYSDGPLGSTSSLDLQLALEIRANGQDQFPELKVRTLATRAAHAVKITDTAVGRQGILDELAGRGHLSPEDVNHAALADDASPFDLRFVVMLAIADFQQARRERRHAAVEAMMDLTDDAPAALTHLEPSPEDANPAMTAYLEFMAESNALGITD